MPISHLQNTMKPADYISSQLQHSADYTLSEADHPLLAGKGVEGYIYQKLTSKKFRKWALSKEAASHTQQAISFSVRQGKPIKCIYPFGGYKLWRIPSSPEVDWAEFFALSYYIKYLAPIVAMYDPGVILTFSSDDAILEGMNNIPTADTEAYLSSFKKLLDSFQPFLPGNLTIEVVRTGDLYQDKDELEYELVGNIPSASRYYAALSEAERRKIYDAADLNMYWGGLKDMTHLSDREKRNAVETALVYHGAYCQLKKRKEFNRGEDKVIISPVVAESAIAVGTTKNGVTKFTTGMGVIESVGDSVFKSHILSPSHITKMILQSSRSPIDLFGLSNLKSIVVLDEEFVA